MRVSIHTNLASSYIRWYWTNKADILVNIFILKWLFNLVVTFTPPNRCLPHLFFTNIF